MLRHKTLARLGKVSAHLRARGGRSKMLRGRGGGGSMRRTPVGGAARPRSTCPGRQAAARRAGRAGRRPRPRPRPRRPHSGRSRCLRGRGGTKGGGEESSRAGEERSEEEVQRQRAGRRGAQPRSREIGAPCIGKTPLKADHGESSSRPRATPPPSEGGADIGAALLAARRSTSSRGLWSPGWRGASTGSSTSRAYTIS